MLSQVSEKIKWPVLIRILHWIVALGVILNLLVLEGRELPHEIFGYLALAAVLARIVYGFVGDHLGHFRKVPVRPSVILSQLKEEFYATPHHSQKSASHNALAWGAYAVVWLCILNLSLSGFMMELDAYWGEDWVEEWHFWSSDILKIMIILHFLGIIIDSVRLKRHTALAMVTGWKKPWNS